MLKILCGICLCVYDTHMCSFRYMSYAQSDILRHMCVNKYTSRRHLLWLPFCCCGKWSLSPSIGVRRHSTLFSGAEMAGLEVASWEGSTQPRSTASWCSCFQIRANDHQVQTTSCGAIFSTSQPRLFSSRWVTAGCSNDEQLLLSVQATGEKYGHACSCMQKWRPELYVVCLSISTLFVCLLGHSRSSR